MSFADSKGNLLGDYSWAEDRSVSVKVGKDGTIADSSKWRLAVTLNDEYMQAFDVDPDVVLSGRVLAVFNENSYTDFQNTVYETDLRNDTQIRALLFEAPRSGWYAIGHPGIAER